MPCVKGQLQKMELLIQTFYEEHVLKATALMFAPSMKNKL